MLHLIVGFVCTSFRTTENSTRMKEMLPLCCSLCSRGSPPTLIGTVDVFASFFLAFPCERQFRSSFFIGEKWMRLPLRRVLNA